MLDPIVDAKSVCAVHDENPVLYLILCIVVSMALAGFGVVFAQDSGGWIAAVVPVLLGLCGLVFALREGMAITRIMRRQLAALRGEAIPMLDESRRAYLDAVVLFSPATAASVELKPDKLESSDGCLNFTLSNTDVDQVSLS